MDLSAALDAFRITGETLPPPLREAILAHGGAAVAPLLAIFRDESLTEKDDPGEGWAPIHAVGLLADLKDPAAIEPMLDMLEETDWDLIIHDRIVIRLPDFGRMALEPLLARIDETEDDARHSTLCSILSELGVKDERAFQALCDAFESDVILGASSLAQYGDPRGLPMIGDAIEEFDIRWDSPAPVYGLEDLVEAYESLSAAPLPFALRAHADAIRERFESAHRPARSNKIGRNEPCPCGSGKKYKRCCIDKPAPASTGP
jgi:hypothetical protein